MARPRKNAPPDRFTSTELAVGAGISARSFGVLQESGRAPDPVEGSVGKKGTRYWDSFGLGEAALMGAIHKSGSELIMSAKIAHIVIDDFVGPRGYLPSRLDDYLEKRFNPAAAEGKFPWRDVDRKIELRISDDFWLHHLLRTKTDIYHANTAMNGDLIMEIVDRRYVFTDFSFSENFWPSGYNVPSRDPEPTLEITEWERGRDALVFPFHEMVDMGDKATFNQLMDRWLNARQNAVGILRVNVSLAIRNAFDAIHEHRLNTGASFDWTATGKPTPGRYAGVMPDGTPLDPNHPWNKELPPKERSKRLEEIEAYLDACERAEEDKDGEGGSDTS